MGLLSRKPKHLEAEPLRASRGSGRARVPHSSQLGVVLALIAVVLVVSRVHSSTKQRRGVQRVPAVGLRPEAGAALQSGSADEQDGSSSAAGRVVGSQLTRAVPAGVLYAWGLDDAWRLGRIGGDSHFPRPALAHLHIVSAAASRHTLLALAGGAVWSMGHNDSSGGGGHGSAPIGDSGQLGRGGSQRPGPVLGRLQGVRVIQVAAGRYHSVALAGDGRVFTWGLNDWGQLGRLGEAVPGAEAAAAPGAEGRCTHGAGCRSGAPGEVPLPAGMRAVGVSAGRYSTQVVASDGALWVFGLDGCAGGGASLKRGRAHAPRRVGGALAEEGVVAVATGYTFWAAATRGGRVFTCATGDDGYAGTLPGPRAPNAAGELGRGSEPRAPGVVAGIEGAVVAVAAGREHALAVTAAGRVYSWGGGGRGDGVLGRPAAAAGGGGGGGGAPHDRPGLVQGALASERVLLVAAGEYYSLAATASAVYGFGSNAYRATGTAPRDAAPPAVLEPRAALGALGGGGPRVLALAAGYQHALAVVVGEPAAAPDGEDGGGGGDGAGGVAPGRGVPGVEVVLTSSSSSGASGGSPVVTPAAKAPGVVGEPMAPEQKEETAAPAPAAAAALPAAAAPPSTSPAAAAAPTAPALDPTAYLADQANSPNYSAAAYWASWRPGPGFDRVKALAPDVFGGVPRGLNPAYRNPCWGTGPDLTCIPYFHIIGVSKCGTTDLYHRLVMHQGVLTARNKGPHFWDECPYPPTGPCGVGGTGDFGAYVKLFSLASDVIRGRPHAVTGEARGRLRRARGRGLGRGAGASSNTYTSANGVYARGRAAGRPDALNVTMPRLLREAAPYLRLILMLRDPGERLYSAYHYYRWWQKDLAPPSPGDFHNATVRDLAAWAACEAAKGRAACVRGYEPQQLVKGMYGEFLQDWLDHWPRDQLLVLRYEDYAAAPEPHLRAALAFLGVPDADEGGALSEMAAAPVRNASGNKRAPMLPETRALLAGFFAPFNARLAAALGGDRRWLWRPEERAARGAAVAAAAGGEGQGRRWRARRRWSRARRLSVAGVP
ncbi:MAG: P-loop containing nucleoside triphosphate hydrolase protein [Monoraphidium minutum]|nr:MAG: P-loop containing nucleoside triphosphate hydrolase protein [Monoraphidium minutum]